LLEIYDLAGDRNSTVTTTAIEEEHGLLSSNPLSDWMRGIPGPVLVPQDFLSAHSFSQTVHITPSIEVEVTIQYPVANLGRYIDNFQMIAELLRKLGPEGGGFLFGYDILPEPSRLDDSNSIEIFTGNTCLTDLTSRSS